MGCPMGPTLLSICRSAQGAERVAATLKLLARVRTTRGGATGS